MECSSRWPSSYAKREEFTNVMHVATSMCVVGNVPKPASGIFARRVGGKRPNVSGLSASGIKEKQTIFKPMLGNSPDNDLGETWQAYVIREGQ
jgi:hypothetical protein